MDSASLLAFPKQWKNRRDELASLNEAARKRPPVTPAKRINPDEIPSSQRDETHWAIKVPGQKDQFMRVRSGALNSETFVVHVDTEAFYAAWLKSSPARLNGYTSTDCRLRSDMPSDRKFNDAAAGFAAGRDSPVPLAEVKADKSQQKNEVHIGFTDGVTRSFWLIANRAESFPVMVRGHESAKLLSETAGAGVPPISLTDLFAQETVLKDPLRTEKKSEKTGHIAALEQRAARLQATPPRQPGARRGR